MSWFFLLHLPFHTFRIIIIFFNCSLYTVHTRDLVDFHFGFLASIYRLLMPSFCRCVHCHPELSSNSQNKHLPRSDNENHLNQLFTTWPNFRITLFLALFFSLHRFLFIYFMVIFFFHFAIFLGFQITWYIWFSSRMFGMYRLAPDCFFYFFMIFCWENYGFECWTLCKKWLNHLIIFWSGAKDSLEE